MSFPPIDEAQLSAFAERIASLNRRMAAVSTWPIRTLTDSHAMTVAHEALRREREAVWREVPEPMQRYLEARLTSMRSQGAFAP